MSSLPILSILEKSNVSPSPSTVSNDASSLPLTFMDIPHIASSPVHFVLFYQLQSLTNTEFTQTIVPKLKHSLSITLQHFLPFAGNIIVYPTSTTIIPEIRYVEGDSVKVTSAKCNLDFDDLTGYHPRNCDKFYHLIPPLGDYAKISDYIKIPLFSLQVTLFPNCGFSIGVTYNHSLADGNSLFCFLNAWTSIAQCGTDDSYLANGTLPFYGRVVNYPAERDKSALVNANFETLFGKEFQLPMLSGPNDKVRSTFVLTRTSIERLKELVATQVPILPYVSAFTITCAYIWCCLAKARNENEDQGFMFAVDVRSRLDPPVPASYIGNCINVNFTKAKTSLLTGNEGFINAARSIGESLHQMLANKDGILADQFQEQMKSDGWPKSIIAIYGSPKLRYYDLDFGWGKPKKFEIVSIDYALVHGALLIPFDGGKKHNQDIEISVCLTPTQMETFATAFNKVLET